MATGTMYNNRLQLQICHSKTDYSLVANKEVSLDGMQIPLKYMTGESWSDVDGAEGDGKITALSIPRPDAADAPGVYTYLRVKSTYDGLEAYSKAIGPLLQIYRPVAKADNVKIEGMIAASPYTKDTTSPYYGLTNAIVGDVWWLKKNMLESPTGRYPGNPIGKVKQQDCDLSNGTQILYKLVSTLDTDWEVGLELPDEVNGADSTYKQDNTHRGQKAWIMQGFTPGAKYKIGARRYLKKSEAASKFDEYILEDSYGPLYQGPTITVFDPDKEAEDDPMYIDQATVQYDNNLDQISFDMVILQSEVDNHGTSTAYDDTELITTTGSELLWSTKRDPQAISTEAPSSYDFDDDVVEAQATVYDGVANTKKYFPDQQPNNSGTNFNHTTIRKAWRVPTILAELAQGSPNYITAKRYRKVDGSITAYSKLYSPTICLFVSAKDSKVRFENLKSTDDGLGVEFDIVWDKNDKNSNGTEVSWSEYSYAWNSSAKPTIEEIPDEWDWNTDIGASKTSHISYESTESGRKHFVIGNLTPGTAYYIRVRRYLDGDIKTYGDYYPIDADMVTTGKIAPEIEPSEVWLVGPENGDYISQGDELDLGWNTDSSSEQQTWRIFELSNPNVSVMSDSTDQQYCTLEEDNPVFFNSDGTYKTSIELAVCVSMGGEEVYSCDLDENNNPIAGTGLLINIAAAPVVSITASSTLTAQPMTIRVVSDNARTSLAVRLVSDGVSLETPAGTEDYPYGDVLWTGYFMPRTEANDDPDDENYISWTVNGTSYYVDLTLPDNLPLVDGGNYSIFVMATDTLTEFSSEEAQHDFTVAWAHQAVMPYDTTRVYSIPDSKIVKIMADGPIEDVFDVYRHTPNGNELIASDVAYGSEVYDLYAPYVFDTYEDYTESGIDQYYVIVDKTADGDIEERDFPYYLEGHGLTFDWGVGNNVESLSLPYNVDISDSYSKRFEGRERLDGSMPGNWNDGYKLESDMETEVYRVNTDTMEGAVLAEQIRKLGQYAGPVCVRTPDGMVFSANVEVENVGVEHAEPITSVKFKVTKIDAPGYFDAYIIPESTG